MFRLVALALALIPNVAAVGVPTDAAVYTFTDGVPDDNLDVVGRVLKFMDPTRAADPKEILRQLGVPPKPAPAAEAGRVLQAMETYEPTTVTYAPTTVTYEPTTETYAPTGGTVLITFSLTVQTPLVANDMSTTIDFYKDVFARLAGPTVTPDMVAITFRDVNTRRLSEAAEAEGRRLDESTNAVEVIATIISSPQEKDEIETNLEEVTPETANEVIQETAQEEEYVENEDVQQQEATETGEVTEEEVPDDAQLPEDATPQPTLMPSPVPTALPTPRPSSKPTSSPTAMPSSVPPPPTIMPSPVPTALPTPAPIQ